MSRLKRVTEVSKDKLKQNTAVNNINMLSKAKIIINVIIIIIIIIIYFRLMLIYLRFSLAVQLPIIKPVRIKKRTRLYKQTHSKTA